MYSMQSRYRTQKDETEYDNIFQDISSANYLSNLSRNPGMSRPFSMTSFTTPGNSSNTLSQSPPQYSYTSQFGLMHPQKTQSIASFNSFLSYPQSSHSSYSPPSSPPHPSSSLPNLSKESGTEAEEEKITIQVWAHNLEYEMKRIASVIEQYCVVGYDCEFPGIIYQPENFDYRDTSLSYDYMKANVDHLDVIQVGFTLSDFNGNLPPYSEDEPNGAKVMSWQFNFKFDLQKNPHNVKSIDLLKKSGIDFDALAKFGIDQQKFGELLAKYKLIYNKNVKWVTFHSMFDYGYLMKLITRSPLPNLESHFYSFFHSLFPVSFDVKYFFQNYSKIGGGLEGISRSFKIDRLGAAHQAGSDSHLTIQLFFAILRTYPQYWRDENFQNNINGCIYGLNSKIMY